MTNRSQRSTFIRCASSDLFVYGCFLVAVVVGVAPEGQRPATTPNRFWILVEDDQTIRRLGTFMPFVLPIVRWICCGSFQAKRPDQKDEKIMHTFIMFLFLSLLRVGIYFQVREYHYYFSDHIFLCWSMLAMIAMELKFCELHPPSCGNTIVLCMNWMLVLAILVEAWTTSRYYHTRQATWTAFVCGGLLFGGIAGCYRQKVLAEKHNDVDDGQRSLLGSNS
mmetsp:Transcript_16332/g.42080  ORF Transcript_16332/g.42080 Transcript_16332/m.42080 type:complete len:222 (+) Transcript_16332:115-780(+)